MSVLLLLYFPYLSDMYNVQSNVAMYITTLQQYIKV